MSACDLVGEGGPEHCDICISKPEINHGRLPHAAVSDITESLPVGIHILQPDESPHITWIGQVTARRDVSKNMIFLSVMRPGTGETDPMEFLVCNKTLTTAADMKTARHGIHLGDVLEGHGWLENSANVVQVGSQRKSLLIIRWVRVVSLWSSLHSSPFEPPIAAVCRLQKAPAIPSGSSSDRTSGRPEAVGGSGGVEEGEAGLTMEAKHVVRIEKWYRGIPLHKLCKYYVETGSCRRISCSLIHDWEACVEAPAVPPTRSELISEWSAWRCSNRTAGTFRVDGDTFHTEDKVAHRMRAREFAKWLCANVPADLLSRGVLDVAGGRGDVSFHLSCMANVNCTVVDTRDEKRRKEQEKYFVAHPEAPRPDYIQAYFNNEFCVTHKQLVDSVGIIIGMHPDQATEPIVDVAMQARKPFVVVPCCVFSREFPDRRLLDGNEVSSYVDFLQYLEEKDCSGDPPTTGIQRSWLCYSGANTILSKLTYATKSA